jgi:membrane protein DedA with SNARE-associated domain
LHIGLVIIWACLGAIVGDNVGFAIGRRFGYPLLLRYGNLLKMNPARIKLGVWLFHRHGGKVVFLGRFVAVLRALAALLAGLNCMPWGRFLFFNAAGAVVWTTGYGMAAYWFGKEIERFSKPASGALLLAAAVAAIAVATFVHRHEADLEAQAEREIPGPLRANRTRQAM